MLEQRITTFNMPWAFERTFILWKLLSGRKLTNLDMTCRRREAGNLLDKRIERIHQCWCISDRNPLYFLCTHLYLWKMWKNFEFSASESVNNPKLKWQVMNYIYYCVSYLNTFLRPKCPIYTQYYKYNRRNHPYLHTGVRSWHPRSHIRWYLEQKVVSLASVF